jgi:HAE1 family hydrophobic/amphiphilic exporter-1
MILAVILVYMIMAAQFESLLYPLIIMFTIPLTFIGVSMGLGLTGRPLSVPAFLGIIMLAGIVVNNGIVLVDYINTLRKRGLSRDEAILKAGPTRLRPILMTTTTTVLGLLPIALGIGDGAEVQAPMATVVTTGLTTSTLLTLIVIPVLYSIFDEAGSFIKKIKLKIDTRRVFIK